MCAWLFAWLAFVAAAPAAAGEERLVDEVVAVVNRHVITRSEVWEEAVLVLVQRRGQAGLRHRVTPAFMKKVLEMLINQRILLDEARRVGLPPVGEQERSRLLAGFRRSFADDEAYTRFLLAHDLSEDDVVEALVRHLRVERLKERKLRVMPAIDEAAVARYYRRHRLDFGGAPLEQVAAAIRLRLQQRQRQRELARWISELGKRSEVKVLVDMTGGDDGL